MSAEHGFGRRWHAKQLGSVDEEIARLSYICGIRLLDPGVIEKVIADDASVCSKPNPGAFRKLRGLVALHYELTGEALRAMGDQESADVLNELRARFAERYDLGGKPR